MNTVQVRRDRYVSNVTGLNKEINQRLERIVGRAARDGAAYVRANSRPAESAYARDAEYSGGIVTAVVAVPGTHFWATMFDKGTLGKRKVPLKQPGRREHSWQVTRHSTRVATSNGLVGRAGSSFTAHRSAEALATGGIKPQYFFIRGKRWAELRLAEYLKNGL